MDYLYSISLNDFMTSPLMKASRSISNITNKVNGFDRKIKTVPGSISQLSSKLQQLEHRRDKAFGVKNIMKYNRSIRKTHRELERLRNMPPPGFMTRMKTMGGGMFGSMALIGGGVMLLRDSFKKFDIQAKADASIKAGLISTNGAAGRSFEQLQAQAKKLQKTTLFGDEQTQEMQAIMLTFKNVRTEIFDRSIPAIQDMATKMKMDGKSAAIMLGKALNDPKTGLTMLTRVGITFSDEQKKVIKSLIDTGQTAKAQGIILDEFNSEFGGSAKAAAKAGMGPFYQLIGLFHDMQEGIGKLAPVINGVSGFLRDHFSIVEYGIPIIVGMIATIKLYSWWQKMVAGETLVWQGVQWLLNTAFMGFPLVWIIAGIAALIAGVIAIVHYTDGWTAQWENLKVFFKRTLDIIKLSFKLVFDGIKLYYMTIFDGLVLAWKWTLHAIGKLSDEQYAKDKAAVKDRMKGRLDETAATAKKLADLTKQAAGGLEWKLKWNSKKDKKGADATSGAKALSTGGTVPTDGGTDVQSGMSGITGGGSKPTNINITIGKFQDSIQIYANNIEESLDEMEDKIISKLLAVVNRANQLQGV